MHVFSSSPNWTFPLRDQSVTKSEVIVPKLNKVVLVPEPSQVVLVPKLNKVVLVPEPNQVVLVPTLTK